VETLEVPEVVLYGRGAEIGAQVLLADKPPWWKVAGKN